MAIKIYTNKAAYDAAVKSTIESQVSLIETNREIIVDGVNVLTTEPTAGDAVFLDEQNKVVFLKGGGQLVKAQVPTAWTHVGYVIDRFGKEVLILNKTQPNAQWLGLWQYAITAISSTSITIKLRMGTNYDAYTNVAVELADTSMSLANAAAITAALEAKATEIGDTKAWWAYAADAQGNKVDNDALATRIIVQCDTNPDYRLYQVAGVGCTIALSVWGDMPAKDSPTGFNTGGSVGGAVSVETFISYVSTNGVTPTAEVLPMSGGGTVTLAAFTESEYCAPLREAYGEGSAGYEAYIRAEKTLVVPQRLGLFGMMSSAEMSDRYGNATAPTKDGGVKYKYPALHHGAAVSYNADGLRAGDWYLNGPDDAVRFFETKTYGAIRASQSKMGTTLLSRTAYRWLARRYNVNNAWIFNGTRGNLNNNNVANSNAVQAVANSHIKVTNAMTEEVFAHNLRNYFSTRRNKRRGRDAMAYEVNWVALLVRSLKEREERTLRIRHNYTFLTSTPRWREIFATEFEGRRMDHEVCDVIIPLADKILSPRSFNNRKGKGSQAAINQVIEDLYEVTEDYTKPARIIKLDFKGFFPSAIWNYAEKCLLDVVDSATDAELYPFTRDYCRWLIMLCVHANPVDHCERRSPLYLWKEHIDPEKSLFTKPVGVGAAIGRLIWQTAMGLYINDEIRWLAEDCGLRVTCFVDDLVFVVPEDRHSYALSLIPELRLRLAEKNIRLNERKFYDQPAHHGLEFLGSHIRPHRIHLNRPTVERAFSRVEDLNRCEHKEKNLDGFLSTVNSYTGLLKARTDHRILQELIESIDPAWNTFIQWNARRQCVQPRPAYTLRQRLNRKYHLKLHNHEARRKAAAA